MQAVGGGLGSGKGYLKVSLVSGPKGGAPLRCFGCQLTAVFLSRCGGMVDTPVLEAGSIESGGSSPSSGS